MRHVLASVYALIFVLAFTLASCGKENTGENPNPPPVTPPNNPGGGGNDGDRQTLRVWGAYWCTTCDSTVRNLNERLAEHLGRGGKLKIEVMVPPQKANAEVTADDIQKCKEKVKLELPYTADSKWQSYRKHVSENDRPGPIPAAALFDAAGNLKQNYSHGFDPEFVIVDVTKKLQ